MHFSPGIAVTSWRELLKSCLLGGFLFNTGYDSEAVQDFRGVESRALEKPAYGCFSEGYFVLINYFTIIICDYLAKFLSIFGMCSVYFLHPFVDVGDLL